MPKKKTSARQLDREIAQALASRPQKAGRLHATKAGSSSHRWIHKDVAKSFDVPEDVVRRIYAAVQTAKRQGLYGGYLVDLIDRSVGRSLRGREYNVAAKAKEHLGYDLPSGYQGPKPKGSAKEPLRPQYDDPKISEAAPLISHAEAVIKDVLRRRKHPIFGWDWGNEAADREILRQAAEELDVAADLYEEAGLAVRGGTLHERAKLARRVDYAALESYQ